MYLFLVDVLAPLPVLFGVWAVVTVVLWRRYASARRVLVMQVVALLPIVLYTLPAVVYVTYSVWEWGLRPAGPETEFEALVVLGGGIAPEREGQAGVQRLGDDTLKRCLHAAAVYHRKGGCPVIVCGGNVDPSLPGETLGHVMGEFLRLLGVSAEHVLVDDQSRDTYENAVEALRIARGRNLERLAVVTDGVHLPRAAACFRKLGANPALIPATNLTRDFHWSIRSFLPSDGAAQKHHAAFHELLGYVWFKLRGRL